MHRSACALVLLLLAGCGGGGADAGGALSPADELGFRQLRQDYHVACMTGDLELLRSRWTPNAVLTTSDGVTHAGPDAIADAIASSPNFGEVLVLTPESSWWVVMRGAVAEYGFESVSVDLGGQDARTTTLASMGAQNPAVQIVEHTHSTGLMTRQPNGRWLFQELRTGSGPLPPAPGGVDGGDVSAQAPGLGLPFGDELGFLRMRQNFHLAGMRGDPDLLRTVWAVDAVFTTGAGAVHRGADAIVEFMSSSPTFGRMLVLTPESSQRIDVEDEIAEYGFECVTIVVDGDDATTTTLASEGTQNPAAEIVRHTNSTGRAVQDDAGRWLFQEFNGGGGPLPPTN